MPEVRDVNVAIPTGTTATPVATSQVDIRPFLIVGYLVITRIGHLNAARIGIPIDQPRLFLTDLVLIALLVLTFVRQPQPLLNWLWVGSGLRTTGFIAFALLWLSVAYFALAVASYGKLAMRDLAIFGYVTFFPVTMLAMRSWRTVELIVRWTVLAGVLLAGLLVLDYFLDGFTGLYAAGFARSLTGGIQQSSFGGGDVGGFLAFSAVGAVAFAMSSRSQRTWWSIAGVGCSAALALPQTRSAMLGLVVACAFLVAVFGLRKYALYAAIVFGVAGASVILAPSLPETLPGVETARKLNRVLSSGFESRGDANAQFRLLRWYSAYSTWRQSPIWGVGFGKDIVARELVTGSEQQGEFNQGMPHNTFLMILARTGLVGITLYLGAILSVLWPLFRRIRWAIVNREPFPSSGVATLAMLVSMLVYANFVLFFERPMHAAAFWILMAAGANLARIPRGSLEYLRP